MASNSEKGPNAFMPLYGGDYLRDTMHLTAMHDGIYIRLLMHYWHAQRPLPNDRQKLEGIARVRDDIERKALKSVLDEFFPVDGDVRRNKRMDHEIEYWRQLRDRKSAAGRAGGQSSAKSRAERQALVDGRSTVVQRSSSPPPPPPPPSPPPPPPPPPQAGLPLAISGGSSTEEQGQKLARTSQKSATPARESAVAEVWNAYCSAYEERYHVKPTRNARVNGQLANFVSRVPMEEAPKIAEFYLTHNKPIYVEKAHSVGMLLIDAEGLRTQWLRGRKITRATARDAETVDEVAEAVAGAKSLLRKS